MPNNYQDPSVVVPVFTGINDAPQVPTASQAGNGSDIIARINNLLTFLDTDVNDLDSRLTTVENSSSPTNSANILVNVSNTDDILWVKYLPYYSGIGTPNFDLATASELDSAGSNNLSYIRSFFIINNSTIDLKDFIEFNGIGFYFFLSGTFGGAYNDQSNTSQGGNVSLEFTELSTPTNVKILDLATQLSNGFLLDVDWIDQLNGTQSYLPFDPYSPSTNTFMALEVQSTEFSLDFQLDISVY